MRWEFTPAAERALARVALTLPHFAGPEIDAGLELLAALFEDEEGAAFQWLSRLDPNLEGADPLPLLNPFEASGPDGKEVFPLGRELIRHLPLALSGILRSSREVSNEIWGDPTISSEALAIGVFRRSLAGREWLESIGISEQKLAQSINREWGEPIAMEESIDLDFQEAPAGLIRLVDAVGNRLREGLRVLEDHYRFLLENAWLVSRLKKMRHEVDRLCSQIPGSVMSLDQRDIQGDVGAGLRTGAERRRDGFEGVVRANWKRVQEALRSLEEHAKVLNPETAHEWEQLRYESYGLEKRASEGPKELLASSVLMMLIGSDCLLGIETTIREATLGGVDVVQLREKGISDRALLALAEKVRYWTRKAGVMFIMNDRPDIAKLVGADGVHFGQEDLPLNLARKVLPPEVLIGASTHTPSQMEKANLEGADYLGVGPVFPSKTKVFEDFAGLNYVQFMSRNTSRPWFAIGGIGPGNIQEVIQAGASRVAISHAICQSEDPQGVARYLRLSLGARPRD